MCVEIHFTKQTKLAKLTNVYSRVSLCTTVADPGFPIGGDTKPLGECQPLMWVLFGENM